LWKGFETGRWIGSIPFWYKKSVKLHFTGKIGYKTVNSLSQSR